MQRQKQTIIQMEEQISKSNIETETGTYTSAGEDIESGKNEFQKKEEELVAQIAVLRERLETADLVVSEPEMALAKEIRQLQEQLLEKETAQNELVCKVDQLRSDIEGRELRYHVEITALQARLEDRGQVLERQSELELDQLSRDLKEQLDSLKRENKQLKDTMFLMDSGFQFERDRKEAAEKEELKVESPEVGSQDVVSLV